MAWCGLPMWAAARCSNLTRKQDKCGTSTVSLLVPERPLEVFTTSGSTRNFVQMDPTIFMARLWIQTGIRFITISAEAILRRSIAKLAASVYIQPRQRILLLGAEL